MPRTVSRIVSTWRSSQEKLVAIRSVYAHVAHCAFLELGVQQIVPRRLNIHALIARSRPAAVVALQADGEDHRTPQQLGIHRAVRIMAGFAAFDADRRILARVRSRAWHVRQSSNTCLGCISEKAWGIVALPPRASMCALAPP